MINKVNLKVALLPIDILEGDVQANLSKIQNGLYQLDRPTDLVILPEMVTTGFKLDAEFVEKVSETVNGASLIRMKELAREFGSGICGSFSCLENGKYYNRGFFINPDNDTIIFYNKRHLFSLGGEHQIYTNGTDEAPIVNFRGWNIMMTICYDLRFPVWCRNRRCNYDILIVPANWPKSREYAWKQLLIARAIENQAYLCGCNRLGKDHYGSYSGDLSVIIDNRGKIIKEGEDCGPVCAILDKENLTKDREKFGVWRDADDFAVLL